jgi:hypothetical protein
MNMVPRIQKCGSKTIMWFQEKLVFFAHGRSTLWVVRQKHGYIEHTNLDFESAKCVTKMRLRDTP